MFEFSQFMVRISTLTTLSAQMRIAKHFHIELSLSELSFQVCFLTQVVYLLSKRSSIKPINLERCEGRVPVTRSQNPQSAVLK